jgi:urease accessory protein
MSGLLTALQHADSAFPSGGFAFSNGIEGLTALGAPLDRAGLAATAIAAIRYRWASFDRLALIRARQAGDDLALIGEIDRAVEAATLVAPLRVGSKRHGSALLAAHIRLATPGADAFRAAIDARRALGHLAVVQGFVWRAIGLSQAEAVAISGYAAAGGLIAAAVRLGTIGAVDAQAVLKSVLDVLAELIEVDVQPDAKMESFVPWIDAAALRHTRAHVRLFAS